MNRSILSALTLAVAALSAGQALAAEPVGLTREQVLAELADARASGDVIASFETGQKLNELFPAQFARKTVEPGKTRADVVAELAQARRSGELLADAETGLKVNERFAAQYPAQPAAHGKTRDEVRAEFAEAKRNGDVVIGEIGLKLNELYPSRYPSRANTQPRSQTSNHATLDQAHSVDQVASSR